MIKSQSLPTWAWVLYQAKQIEAQRRSDETIEETLNYLAGVFTSGDIPDTEEGLTRKIDNHLAGIRQKLRRRRNLQTRVTPENEPEDVVQATAARDAVEQLHKVVKVTDWQLLTALADGRSYREIASRTGRCIGTVKSTVSRIRKQLRDLDSAA